MSKLWRKETMSQTVEPTYSWFEWIVWWTTYAWKISILTYENLSFSQNCVNVYKVFDENHCGIFKKCLPTVRNTSSNEFFMKNFVILAKLHLRVCRISYSHFHSVFCALKVTLFNWNRSNCFFKGANCLIKGFQFSYYIQ